MTEPVHALATPLERTVDPALLPRRFYGGDAGWWGVFAGATVGIAALGVVVGAPVVPAILLGTGSAPFVAWLVDRVVLAHKATARFNVALAAIGETTGRGRFVEGETALLALAHQYRARPGLQAVARYNVAVARMQRGDYETALAMFRALDAFKVARRQPIITNAPWMVALCLAQLGRVGDGWQALTEARGRPRTQKMYDATIEALLLTREGRFAEAAEAYERQWPDFERLLSSVAMQEWRARRAFVLDQLGGHDVEVERLVAATQPARADALAHLGTAWPEMAAFLERRGIVRPSTT